MDHDQLFKELLRVFLVEFLELFFPEIAAELHVSTNSAMHVEFRAVAKQRRTLTQVAGGQL